MRVSQGFWGTREHWQNIEGNKGTLANFWEQGNKIRKITVRKHSENVWEHGNIGQLWKGTREQGPPWETLISTSLQHLNPSSFRIKRNFCPTIIGCYYWNDIHISIRKKEIRKLFKKAVYQYYFAQYIEFCNILLFFVFTLSSLETKFSFYLK